jgi:hypothetical protein
MVIVLEESLKILDLCVQIISPDGEDLFPLVCNTIDPFCRTAACCLPLGGHETVFFKLTEVTVDHPRRRWSIQKTKVLDVLNKFISIGWSGVKDKKDRGLYVAFSLVW